ncbi:hypothetical protein LTR74_015173 [Friedmanniomyces endolithicus]|nr:hypothetical protein LTR74_015173 [Friedmanniomyces endolithicus]
MATGNVTGSEENMSMTAELPPVQQKTADELVAEMKKMPLFMTSMDDMDEDNDMLEAIKALVYEGTRAEVADNFRVQGNDCVKTKQWREARDSYTKALAALKGPQQPLPADAEVVKIDEEAEEKQERTLEEACYANRALCNLEMKNYGSCSRDCAAALRMKPRNVKAWYRAASACLALDKVPEALDACQGGLKFDPANSALQLLLARVQKRQAHLAGLEKTRRDREQRAAREEATLRLALKQRNIIARRTANPPDVEDAAMKLTNPLDAKSTLSFPMILLYPLHAQSDFVKACGEDETIAQHLEYILPTPWDEMQEYSMPSVECYMETVQGGLIKAGKKVSHRSARRRRSSLTSDACTNWITESWILAAHKSAQWKLHAVYSRSEDQAKTFGSKHECHNAYTSLDSFFADNGMQAVYIASPNSLHYEQAKHALLAKKHVILEKPATSTPEELDDLFRIAKQKGVFLIEAFRHIQEANYKLLHKLVNDEKRLGPIYGASFTYASYSSRYNNVLAGEVPNIFNLDFSGGSLVDIGVYPVTFAIALFGEPKQQTYVPFICRTGVDGGGVIVLRYENFGVQINHSKSYTSAAVCEVYGEKGTITVNGTTDISSVKHWDPVGKKTEELAGSYETVEKPNVNMVEEAVEFARIVDEGDWEAAGKLEEISRIVIKVTADLRRQNGILYPADKP